MAGKRVLVVEDERDFLDLVVLVLTRAGYEVRPCMAGAEVLNAVAEFKPDVVVLDVMLPGIDGYTLRHQLAARPETKDLPVVVLTGLEPARTLFKEGLTTFLTKPVKVNDLLESLKKALKS